MNLRTLFFIGLTLTALAVTLFTYRQESQLGGTVIAVFQGGTGTTTAPASQVLYAGNSGVYQSVATGTVSSANSALTVTSNRYVLAGDLALTVSTTTTNMFSGTAGQVLAFSNGGWFGVATTTFSGGLVYSAGNVTPDCATITGSAALCDGDDATGAGGGGNQTKWATSTDPVSIYTNSAYRIGVGSTTPWAGISFASTSMNYSVPAVAISTSTNAAGNLFSIFATTTVQKTVSAALSLLRDVGTRIGIGSFSQYGFGGLLDHLFVQGRINTGDWISRDCVTMYPTVASVTADTGNMPCPGWSFLIDTAGSITTVSRTVAGEGYSGAINATMGANAANNGVGIFYAPVGAANQFKFSSSTPVLEGTVGISPYSASSTSFYFGFSNINSASNAFETFPTAGCFFNASSTAQTGNWYAVANVVAGAGSPTYVNTGIASSSNINMAFGAVGNYYRMRIEADREACRFYIQAPDSATTTMVANVTTTIASTTAMTPGVWLGYTTAGRVKTMESTYLRLWTLESLFR